MNTAAKYITRTEHHSGITRCHLNPDYVPPPPTLWRWPIWLRATLIVIGIGAVIKFAAAIALMVSP